MDLSELESENQNKSQQRDYNKGRLEFPETRALEIDSVTAQNLKLRI